MSLDSSPPSIPQAAGAASRAVGPVRTIRSALFFFSFFLQATVVLGLGQRFIIYPAIALAPRRRHAIMARWFRFHAAITMALARRVGKLRVTVRGALPAESCVVVMNHQSVIDIPLAVSLVRGPQVVIPTRDRYRVGIPGISPMARLGGFPFVSQRRRASREELLALQRAADDLAAGETTLVIFPEGHRTRDGSLGRFMRSGLRLILPRAKRPVYYVVADGVWHARTATDVLRSFAGSELRVSVHGPLPPPTEETVDAFIDDLHQRMAAALADQRATGSPAEPAVDADRAIAAR